MSSLPHNMCPLLIRQSLSTSQPKHTNTFQNSNHAHSQITHFFGALFFYFALSFCFINITIILLLFPCNAKHYYLYILVSCSHHSKVITLFSNVILSVFGFLGFLVFRRRSLGFGLSLFLCLTWLVVQKQQETKLLSKQH